LPIDTESADSQAIVSSSLHRISYRRNGKPDSQTSHQWKERNELVNTLDTAVNGKPSRTKEGNDIIGNNYLKSPEYDVPGTSKSSPGEPRGWFKSPYTLSSPDNANSRDSENRARSGLSTTARQAEKFHGTLSPAWKPSINVWRPNHQFPVDLVLMAGLPRDKTATSHKSRVKLLSAWRPSFSASWPHHTKSQSSQLRRTQAIPPRDRATSLDKSREKLSSSSALRSRSGVWWRDRKSPAVLSGDRTTKSRSKLSSAWRPSLRARWLAVSADNRNSHSVMVVSEGRIQPVVPVESARRRMGSKHHVHQQPVIPQSMEKRVRSDEEDDENDKSLFGLLVPRASRRRRRSVTGKRAAAAAGLTAHSRSKARRARSKQIRDYDDDDDDDDDDEDDEDVDRRDAEDDDDSDEELQDLEAAEMANAEENVNEDDEDEDEEEEEEEEKRSDQYKREDKNQVTVSKELMKQLEDSIYNRVVAFVKAQPSGTAANNTSPATGSTTPAKGSTTPASKSKGKTTPTKKKGKGEDEEDEEEEEEELIEEDLEL